MTAKEYLENHTEKDYLEQYCLIKTRVDMKKAQIEEWRELAQAAGGCSDNIGCGRNSLPYDKVGEITAKIVDEQQRMTEDIEDMLKLKRQIESLIKQMSNGKQRTVLEKCYINGNSFDDIAEDLGYSYRNVCYLHRAALGNFSLIFSKCCDILIL